MKRAGDLCCLVADPDNLRLAFWKAQRGKSYARSVERYRANLDEHLLGLRHELLAGHIRVGDYHFFTIHDPKEREICAPAFREQVIHHALMNVCHAFFERKQIFDSYASRKGKGTYAALDRAKDYSKQYKWFLKLDVRKFFGSIKHEILKSQLSAVFKDQKLIHFFEQIIDSYPAKGLPIGNLTSQYFANHYLSQLDHFIKEELKCQAYVRYMDDMVLWHDDKQQLKEWKRAIDNYVNKRLELVLKPEQLNRTLCGLPFLGYILFPTHVFLSQTSKKRFARKIAGLGQQFEDGLLAESDYQRRLLPLLAFTNYADAKSFRKNVLLGLRNAD